MLLSIIIPVYNVEKYIKRCLKSILNQNVQSSLYEIIIIDDESPDNSIGIIKENFSYVENIKIISQKNKGLGGARNTGILNSNGKYLWFIDSDDDIPDNILKKVLEELNTESEIYTFNYNKISESQITKQVSYESNLDNMIGSTIVDFFIISQVWRNIYKKKFLLDNKLFFREHFLHEDGEFNMRAVTLAQSVTYRNYEIYNYYTNNNSSITNNISLKNQIDLLKYFDISLEFENSFILNQKQRVCINKYLNIMLGLLFINAISLSKIDFIKFKKLIEKRKKNILKIIRTRTPYQYFKVLSLICITAQWYYRFVYHKTILKN